MQLGSKEHPDERFNHYLEKTYKKTASLIACCCKAVSLQTLMYSSGNCESESPLSKHSLLVIHGSKWKMP